MNKPQNDIDDIIAVLEKDGFLPALMKLYEIRESKGSKYLSDQLTRKVQYVFLQPFLQELGFSEKQSHRLADAILDRKVGDYINAKGGAIPHHVSEQTESASVPPPKNNHG